MVSSYYLALNCTDVICSPFYCPLVRLQTSKSIHSKTYSDLFWWNHIIFKWNWFVARFSSRISLYLVSEDSFWFTVHPKEVLHICSVSSSKRRIPLSGYSERKTRSFQWKSIQYFQRVFRARRSQDLKAGFWQRNRTELGLIIYCHIDHHRP